MKPSYPQLNEHFQNSLEGFLWDQWVSIGLGGSARSHAVPFVIDPEALLLATTQFMRHDSRVMEEVLDWILRNGQLLSVQRIKNLKLNHGVGSIPALMEIVRIVSETRHKNWKTLLSLEKDVPKSKEPRIFARDLETRGLSSTPDPSQCEAFLFRMRTLFGGNARAEVLTWLLTHRSGHPARIARETGWFSKSVQTILNDLEQSGLVEAQRKEREKLFRLDREPWLNLLQPSDEIQWFTQPPFYLACHYLRETLQKLAQNPDGSERLQAIVIREQLTSIHAALDLADRGEWFSGHQHLSGGALTNHFVESVSRIGKVMQEERELLVSGRGVIS